MFFVLQVHGQTDAARNANNVSYKTASTVDSTGMFEETYQPSIQHALASIGLSGQQNGCAHHRGAHGDRQTTQS